MKVYVVGRDNMIERMFRNRGHEVVDYLIDADIVQFTGGADVTPSLYGDATHHTTFYDEERDLREAIEFKEAVELGLPIVGICRGAQFINVLSGGTMIQDCDNHAIRGTHEVIDVRTDDKLQVTSTHHQMMLPSPDATLIAIAERCTYKNLEDDDNVLSSYPLDTEVVYYPKTKALCFQPHPEYVSAGHECQKYYFKLLEEVLHV